MISIKWKISMKEPKGNDPKKSFTSMTPKISMKKILSIKKTMKTIKTITKNLIPILLHKITVK
jgi:hypothetical protein